MIHDSLISFFFLVLLNETTDTKKQDAQMLSQGIKRIASSGVVLHTIFFRSRL